ncbi:MAG: TetR/AcrR family transcriptional regulator [Ruminiclostridium sp.]
MSKPLDVKETIIQTATELIVNSEGKVGSITTRAIAEKAGVGIGLINYHFQTKDNLVEICVQRIIEKVITDFKPVVDTNLNCIDKLKMVVKLVMDFLTSNPSVSRISILGDYNSPKILDNTMKTVMGFSISLNGIEIEEKHKKLMLFGLTSILQAVFLRKNISGASLGFDFNVKEERDRLIDFYVENMFGGLRV